MKGRGRTAVATVALAWAASAQPLEAHQDAPPAPAPPAAAPEPATAEAFHAEIGRLYRIDRAALRDEESTQAVAATLDVFWNRVKADKAAYLPLLRAELVRTDNPPFFYFDGAELLRDASDDRADGALALGVLERVDLSQINPSGYLIALNWYVNHGFDTRRAALRWLELPRDTTVIVQPFPHVFYYSRLEAMIFSLFGMDEQRFVGDLIERVQTARDDLHIFYLLHCIWSTATPEGRAAMTAYAEDASKPEAARRYAREMLTHRSDGPPPTESADELRRQRREVIARPFVHDSFERFHAITDQLVRIAS